MTLAEAKKLKWGTVLRPSKKQHDLARRWTLRKAIFLGISRDGNNLTVIQYGRKTVSHWSPIFWMPEPEVVNHG